ncbi:MAG TPA: phosphoribosylformylglycinamidine synthase subunit PurQ, partial [Candidatus Nitrosocosmicus sp.]|nr:phosphoribosylformylglycinamidine synthase subunit PurQ [Candidatus Nitrosocosmicus sp.]
FGDRVYKKATASYIIEPGTLAVTSPVMKLVKEFIKKGVPVLGICNGFQILVKAGVLPGRLEQNKSKEFYCNWTECEVVGDSFFGDASLLNKTYKIPVAHGYGRYEIDEKEYSKLEKNKQIFLKYKNGNPNGSYKNIAGITNKEKTVFGMMPHPERTPDGSYFMKAIENYTSRSSLNKLQ